MRRLRYSVPYIAGKNLPKDSDPAPCGAGPVFLVSHIPQSGFQSTRPLRGGTASTATSGYARLFQSTRPLRGGTRLRATRIVSAEFQSTRPLRGGTLDVALGLRHSDISIHPPLAGRDENLYDCNYLIFQFQSTRPLRGGTGGLLRESMARGFQSTRPLRGGTTNSSVIVPIQRFQSTRPLRGGTAILHKKTVQNIAYCTKSAFTLTVLSGFLALMRPFFCQTCTNFGANLPKNRCSLPVRTLIPSGPPPADSRH